MEISESQKTIGENSPSFNSFPLRLYKDDLETLRGWLGPLDAEMEAERSRLLKSHLSGTRKWLLDTLFEFLAPMDSNASKNDDKVLWLCGNAGVGKSVMTAFCAKELEERDLLAGMFFAKHDEPSRNSAPNLIKTLAFQLCMWNPKFGQILLAMKQTQEGRDIVYDRTPIDKMFSVLISDPLVQIALENPHQSPIVLVVDALDETGKLGHRSAILQVFSVHWKKLPSYVKLLVTSRPEYDIFTYFSHLKTRELKATDDQNNKDAIIYATHFLRKLKAHPTVIRKGTDLLVKKSGGLFVWLVLSCKFLESSKIITIELIESLDDGNTENGMNILFGSSFDRMFSSTSPPFLSAVLFAIVLVCEPLTAEDFSKLLNIKISDVNLAVDILKSILNIDEHGKIRIFHKSVADYLTDPKCCIDPRFAINYSEQHSVILTHCFNVLNKDLHFNICEVGPELLHADIPDFGSHVSKISKHLIYSAKFWISHALLCSSEGVETISKQNEKLLDLFSATHLLHWVEVLSVCHSLSITQILLPQLVPHISTVKTANLLMDLKRLVGEYFKLISHSALLVYHSALVLCPEDTGLFKIYYSNFNSMKLPKVITGKDQHWSPCLATFEGHTDQVNGVAWWASTDGEISLIASASGDNSVRLWDAFTGIEIQQFLGHTKGVNSVAFSKDGTKLVSGSYDKSIKLWDIET
ncbi:hypothetical protein HK096_003082, partial [Nowakowskiella sp. JEL0078]